MKTRQALIFVSLAACVACAGASGPENGAFTVNLDGRDLHYEVHGQGPVVMTLPNSWGLSHQGLRAMYRPFEDHVTMVYFDPRGMGRSGPVRDEADMSMAAVREDFDKLRRHLGLERVHAIGWSNGAANLILLAAERPETLSSAIFLHGLAHFGPQEIQAWAEAYPGLMRSYEEFQAEVADESLSDDERTAMLRSFWLGEIFPASCADPEAAPALMERLFGEAEFSFAHADYANRELEGFDARDKLESIATRSLVVAGEHDTLPVEMSRAIAETLADSEFVLFENSGHHAPAEEPERFEKVLLEFLGERP